MSTVRTAHGLLQSGILLLMDASFAQGQCSPTWQDVGGVWGGPAAPKAAVVNCLSLHSPRLYIGGGFVSAGTTSATLVASRDARSWQPLGSGISGFGAYVYGATSIDTPAGSAIEPGVVFSGIFFEAGGVRAHDIARWSGNAWSAVGQWQWGYRFTALLYGGSGMAAPAARLYAGGMADSVHGTFPYTIAAWDGAGWAPLGSGVAPLPPQDDATVEALAAFDDDGPGPRLAGLYVGGDYWYAGGLAARNIARWDGAAWETLGTGMSGTVESLCVFDADGPGPQHPSLFAGGQFQDAGSVPDTDGLARWDGAQWHAVPGWHSGPAKVTAVFDDDGPGPRKPALFIGGFFNIAGGVSASRVVRWDGQQWSPLPGPTGAPGVSGWGGATEVKALAVFDEDGPGPNPGGLYVGGFFTHAGGVPMNSIARWGCPAPAQCYANCSLDFHPVTGQHILTVADFGCFQSAFVLQDPYADCNQDAAFTVADFGCFQSKFVAGCP